VDNKTGGRIHFFSESLPIEGDLHLDEGDRAAVLTHPHPLYGGDMDNHVVTGLTRSLAACGYTTLRFNFRGVGASRGTHDHGKGEQQDVLAAVHYLKDLGKTHILLAGYSFGAWVNARAAASRAALPMIMVAPPVAAMDFDGVGSLPGLLLVVTGAQDPYAPPGVIEELMGRWNPQARLVVIDGTDHFFARGTRHLEEAVMDHLTQRLT